MALDEVLLATAAQRARPLLRLYAWDRPSVSFGYFQAYPAALAPRYALVRRPTGGGIVYHDGDTTYTVVVPAGHRLHRLRAAAAYCVLHEAVAAALATSATLMGAGTPAPRGQYECFESPVAGDVVEAGRKLAGGAQRRTRSGMLHQGSIATAVRPATLCAGFARILQATFTPWSPDADTLARADELAREKYGTADWNRHRQPGGRTPATG
jgi:lipoate-protein ligase A